MYNETHCQRKAIQMYAANKTQEEVISMLLEENADKNQATALSYQFLQDYAFLFKEKRKKRWKNAEKSILIGGVVLFGAFLLTVMSYFSTGGSYVSFSSLSFIGVVFLIKGIIEKKHLEKETKHVDSLLYRI